jgi:hypothetical protein
MNSVSALLPFASYFTRGDIFIRLQHGPRCFAALSYRVAVSLIKAAALCHTFRLAGKAGGGRQKRL